MPSAAVLFFLDDLFFFLDDLQQPCEHIASLLCSQPLLVRSGLWRVEWADSEGAMYITIFVGPEAEARARDYHEAISDGRLASHIAGNQRAA